MPALDGVLPIPAERAVVSVAAEQRVLADPPVQLVVSAPAVQPVRRAAADDRVGALPSAHLLDVETEVVALTRRAVVGGSVDADAQALGSPGVVDEISARPADIDVAARVLHRLFGRQPAEALEEVVAVAPDERVVAVTAQQRVVARPAVDRVRSAMPAQHRIVACAAVDRRRPLPVEHRVVAVAEVGDDRRRRVAFDRAHAVVGATVGREADVASGLLDVQARNRPLPARVAPRSERQRQVVRLARSRVVGENAAREAD
ncbi:MAG: hypothetical protein M3N04_05280 [Actinomycetota bacterium]|nr:hypothetical protein [Actinomycetota bacterium]